MEKNDSKLMLFFKPVVTKSEEKRLYEWRNLFAEIGGYVGVFLGYSNLVEVELPEGLELIKG